MPELCAHLCVEARARARNARESAPATAFAQGVRLPLTAAAPQAPRLFRTHTSYVPGTGRDRPSSHGPRPVPRCGAGPGHGRLPASSGYACHAVRIQRIAATRLSDFSASETSSNVFLARSLSSCATAPSLAWPFRQLIDRCLWGSAGAGAGWHSRWWRAARGLGGAIAAPLLFQR